MYLLSHCEMSSISDLRPTIYQIMSILMYISLFKITNSKVPLATGGHQAEWEILFC